MKNRKRKEQNTGPYSKKRKTVREHWQKEGTNIQQRRKKTKK